MGDVRPEPPLSRPEPPRDDHQVEGVEGFESVEPTLGASDAAKAN